MKVEDLSQFGRPLGLPKKAQRKQVGIVLTALRERFGLLEMVPFFISLLAEQRRIRRAHSDLVARAREIGPEVAREFVLLTSLFQLMARREGREPAYVQKPINCPAIRILSPSPEPTLPPGSVESAVRNDHPPGWWWDER